jgi:hypothetical protein
VGFVDPVQGYGLSVAVTMLTPDTTTTVGDDNV